MMYGMCLVIGSVLKMKLCYWLLLCALTATCHSTVLEPKALKRIVEDFLSVAGPTRTGFKQFSFLMALTPQECQNGKVTYRPQGPVINNNFEPTPSKNPNYISAYPDYTADDENQKRCTEYKLLFPSKSQKQSPAKMFEQIANSKVLRPNGGCVIFFTTNTPCTNKCFSGDENCDISKPLGENPFQNWGKESKSVHQYFVYMQQYRYDITDTNAIIEKFKNLANMHFRISRCYKENNVLQCKTDCNSNPKFCL
ncbi:uncharacterized protein LOC121309061 isoform X2 [Polyodon spathula]|uniref:uncharacterized protein LOC121309061 isoform X2 n=1 Tax=Polyodon spathula TaxID=7913 RepID=UPI001B7DB7D6|nr:uncharacterized protein LOC121309061 isoform X2 [Polyodon spathula]